MVELRLLLVSGVFDADARVLTGLHAAPSAARWSKSMPVEFLHTMREEETTRRQRSRAI
jgi:hypothetical protein